MKSAIDPSKLLGFRVLVSDAAANGSELDPIKAAEKLNEKIGLKEGIK